MTEEQVAPQDATVEPQIWHKDLYSTGPMTTYSRLYDIVDGKQINRVAMFETSVALDVVGGVHIHVTEGIDLTKYLPEGVAFGEATPQQFAAACLMWESLEFEAFQHRVASMVSDRVASSRQMAAARAAAANAGRIVRPDGSPFQQ